MEFVIFCNVIINELFIRLFMSGYIEFSIDFFFILFIKFVMQLKVDGFFKLSDNFRGVVVFILYVYILVFVLRDFIVDDILDIRLFLLYG